MSMARGWIGGEAADVPKKRRRLTDAEAARVRRKWMKRLKDEGVPVPEIALLWRCSWQHVYREIASIDPEPRDGERRTA